MHAVKPRVGTSTTARLGHAHGEGVTRHRGGRAHEPNAVEAPAALPPVVVADQALIADG
jgi:hypothetical protein